MANRAYLCCSDFERTYPSFENPAYRPELHTLASAKNAVPLLWLALFAPDDLRADEGGEPAPIARRDAAIERLAVAVPRIERALPDLGPLGAHVAPFRGWLQAAKGAFLTIELEEIADLASSRDRFHRDLRKALAYLAGEKATGAAKLLASIADLDTTRALIAPKELFAKARPSKADLVACMNVLGTSHIGEVPWESVPPKPEKKPRPVRLEVALLEALERGDAVEARELLARGADPNVSGHGSTSAMDHVIWGKVDRSFARALVEAGFDLAKRRQGYTALHRAIWADDAATMSELLSMGASTTHPDGFGRAPLTLAAYAGALSCLEVLLGRKPEEKTIKAAIRAAEQKLAAPEMLSRSDQEQLPRVRRALERLRA